jgi:agmatine deiminase
MAHRPVFYGYRMPAEWEPHAATWLSWPHKEESWPGKFEPVPDIFVQIVSNLVSHETVNINVNDEEARETVQGLLSRNGISQKNVNFHLIPTNDAWCRDHGATFISKGMNKGIAAIDWEFNAWGGKYPPYDLDNRVAGEIAKKLEIPVFKCDIVMEGGSIDVNGQGTLLTTESCLLNKNRNPHLKKPEIESYLREYLGVSNILWLGDGIIGDDTDGHIDDITRFVDKSTVVTCIEEDPNDENNEPLQENYRKLLEMKLEDKSPLRVEKLPMPEPIEYESHRLPASYSNFYIANGVVLVPVFNQKRDKIALDILQKLFPSREVVGINCTDLVWGLGAIHCVTQQQPAG